MDALRRSCRTAGHALGRATLRVAITACSGAMLAAAPGGQVPTAWADAATAPVRRHLDERRPDRALAVLEGIGKNRGGPAGEALAVEALFRMGRHKEALARCAAPPPGREVPEHRLWCWAAALDNPARPPDIRRRVREDIRRFSETDPADFDTQFVAARGCYFLRDRPCHLSLLMSAARRAREPEQRRRAAEALFEAVLESPDLRSRIDAAASYLELTPRGTTAREAAFALLDSTARLMDRAAARRRAAQWLAVSPQSPEILTGTGRWLIEIGSPHQALQALERALRNADRVPPPTRPHVTARDMEADQARRRDLRLYLKARALRLLDRPGDALDILEALTRRRPSWGGAAHHMAEILRAAARLPEAIQAYRRAVAATSRREGDTKILAELIRTVEKSTASPQEHFAGRNGVIRFHESTRDAGLAGIPSRHLAWSDVDGDGDDDLLVDGRRLFLNNGVGNFHESAGAVSPGGRPGGGGVLADMDGDGDPDLLRFSSTGSRLFRNVGAGLFEPADDRLPEPVRRQPAGAAAWGDMDGDGRPDLYIAGGERPGIMRGLGTPDHLLHNTDGRFQDISGPAGIVLPEGLSGRGVTWTDVDGDARADIAVANYRLDPNLLWHNLGNGRFEDAGRRTGLRGEDLEGAFGHTLAIVPADVDGDGRMDFYVSNLSHPRARPWSDTSRLLVGDDRGFYTDRLRAAGLAVDETSADAAVADVDNDGDPDLYVTAVYPGRDSRLYLNDGRGRFREVGWLSGTRVSNAWGAAFSDLDRDGFVDLAVASPDGLRIFRNRGNGNHWIGIRPSTGPCGRPPLGARLIVAFDESRIIRESTAGRGSGNQDGILPLGIGRAVEATVRFRGSRGRVCDARIRQVDRYAPLPPRRPLKDRRRPKN